MALLLNILPRRLGRNLWRRSSAVEYDTAYIADGAISWSVRLDSEIMGEVPTLMQPSSPASSRICTPPSCLQQLGRSSSAFQTFAASTFTSRAMASNAKKIERTPVSRAIALLVSQDNIPRERLVTLMSQLCTEMVLGMEQCNTTEVAAFCEAAMKMDYCTQQLADAVLDYLPGKVSELSGVELPGLMWVVAKKDDVNAQLSMELCEAVHRHLDEVHMADLPGLIPIVCALCPASPFLLSALADEVMAQLKDFSAAELVALVDTFGCEVVRRSLFDDKIFKGLSVVVIQRVQEFSQPQLRKVLAVFREICHHHTLLGTLKQMEAVLVPLTNPSSQ